MRENKFASLANIQMELEDTERINRIMRRFEQVHPKMAGGF